jgi:hypothetical protein
MNGYNANSKEFFTALADGALIGSHCRECGAYFVPQRQICPKCHSENTEVVTLSGKGKLAAYTVISVPPVSMAEAGYNYKNPYCVGIVTLAEGPRISAQILDLDLSKPEDIVIGTELEMSPITRGEGEEEKTFLAFKPV